MKTALLVALLGAVAWAMPEGDPRVVVTINTTHGPVTGSSVTFTYPGMRQVFSFFGIPYGADTGGANRFLKPKPVDDWTWAKDVTDSGRLKSKSCIQIDATDATVTQGTEDCLVVHVYTPKIPFLGSNPKLPVMVWLHGGGFISGDGQIFTGLKMLDEDVVLVVPHYRLGLFGFLTTDSEDAPGNAGLYDQLLALQWVQDNIAKFGGDPDSVTIFGESAGGVSVGHHVVSPLSAGLFHKAIMMSGAVPNPWSVEESPLKVHNTIGGLLGCPWDASNPTPYVQCLRVMPPMALLAAQFQTIAQERLQGRHGFRVASPVIEAVGGADRFIPSDPVDALAQGNFNKVPAILGATKHDGSFPLGVFYNEFLTPLNFANNTDFMKFDAMRFFIEALEIRDETSIIESACDATFISRLEHDSFDGLMPGLMDFVGSTLLKGGAWKQALFMANYVPTYFYSFDYFSRYTLFDFFFPYQKPPIPSGVGHGDDLIYFMGLPFALNEEEASFSKMYIRLLVNFANTGNPTPEGTPFLWPQASRRTPDYVSLQQTPQVLHNYPKSYTIAVDELMQGIEIPDAPGAQTRSNTRDPRTPVGLTQERLRAFSEQLEQGQLEWTEDHEATLLKAGQK